GLPAYAPERTRTSTGLSPTRPSILRVYQFRHWRRTVQSRRFAVRVTAGCGVPDPERFRALRVGESVPSGAWSRSSRAPETRAFAGEACVPPVGPLVLRTHVRYGTHRMDLTKRQQEIFDFIRTYTSGNGYPPTVRDIGTAVGLASSSTVHAHLA